MGNGIEKLLRSSFPSLEVSILSDVFNQCDSDVQATIEHLRALFPKAYVVKSQGQAEHQDSLQEPWTPPTQSPAHSPRKLIRSTDTPPRASGTLSPEFMQQMLPISPKKLIRTDTPPRTAGKLDPETRQLMFPPKPARPKEDESIGCTQSAEMLGDSTDNMRNNGLHKRDVRNTLTDVNRQVIASTEGKQQMPHSVHAGMPFLQNLLPQEKPSAKAPRSCRSNSDYRDLSPGTPSGSHDVQASSADWDVITNNAHPAPNSTCIFSASASPNKKLGSRRAAMGNKGLPGTIGQLTNTCSPSTRSSSPDRSLPNTSGATAVQVPQKAGPDVDQEQEGLLQEMFPKLDVDLVRDVLQNAQGDHEKACHQLLVIQNVSGRGGSLDPSCQSSEDGCASASQDGAGSRGDADSANGGYAWDISGVPVDYTFQDLTREQKVALIREELPLCTAEEAHNALEACSDVTSAIASLSQVYDKDGRHVPASSTATLPKEVTELQKIFPSADIEALMNALFVSDNSVDAAKATLQANGMNPIAKPCRMGPHMRSPTPKLASSLFSPPQPADVKQLPLDAQLPHGSGQLPQQGRVWRRNHVDNQKLYDDHRSLAFAYKAEMDRTFQEINKAKAREDWALTAKYRADFEQARLNYRAAQAEAAKAIYRAKNNDLNDLPIKLDLHGLHVHEAIAKLMKTIDDWRATPESIRIAFKRLDVITGKGLHSVGNVARILQAVIQFVEEEGMTYYQKPGKDGVMIHLADTGQPSGQPSMSLNGYG